MKLQLLSLAGACVIASPLFGAPPLYDQNVTPDAIFGSGNANGFFTLDRDNGVELGLRGKLRFPVPLNIFNSNGDGTYTFRTGWGGVGDPLNPEWAFEWSVNSDWDGSSPYLLDDLTYKIGMDFDPGPDAYYLVFDHITPTSPTSFWDHSIGTNGTGNGAGVEAANNAAYVALLAGNNVAQNSWRATFFDNYLFTFDPDDIGRYEYYVSAFDGSGRVAHSAITIFALDNVSLTLDGAGCQGADQDPVTPGHQIKVTLSVRNPDSMAITGYQAFLEFNSATMTYVGATSNYSAMPFTGHIQPIATAEVSPGKLRLDGSTAPLAPALVDDALAATLFFTVTPGGGCGNYVVSFDLGQPFDSEASNVGLPYTTDLLDSPTIVTDATAPSITAQTTLTVNAEPGVCTADIFPQLFPFNSDPPLSPTQAPGVFYTDRYPPFLFESSFFDGDFRLLHQINVADSAANRPPAFSSGFYDTQGRKFDINSGVGSSVSIDLFIGSDWGTNPRRADLWLTTFDSLNDISGFPILGFANTDGVPAGDTFRVFVQDTDQNPSNGFTPGWVNLGLPGGFAYGKWYTLRVTLTGASYFFEVIDGGTTVLSYTDAITFGSVLIGNTIIQAFNFGSTYDVYWDNLHIPGQYPTSSDNCGGLPTVTGVRDDLQPLTSPYPVGDTVITWTATDDCGNAATTTQTVTVLNTVVVNVTVELQGSGPATRCIHFAPDDCGDAISEYLTFSGSLPATVTASIELPCGTWTSLCAKDKQHSQWATTSLTNEGAYYSADMTLFLKAGDTDNDGDVDINDVTLFVAQFGTSPGDGGCPWNGTTRSADFSNNGPVGAEDYSVLTLNWLTTSSCACTFAQEGEDEERPGVRWLAVHDELTAAADLDRNGRVDVRDVEVLEKRYGLSGELSKRMRQK
jgi:hypothetical protein